MSFLNMKPIMFALEKWRWRRYGNAGGPSIDMRPANPHLILILIILLILISSVPGLSLEEITLKIKITITTITD